MAVLDDPRLRAYIEEVVGPQGTRITEALLARDEATDTMLSQELGEKPSHIRKVLYALYEARIAEYHKQKDKETGWLTFFWFISEANIERALSTKMKKDLVSLEGALDLEQSHQWFTCPSGQERFDFSDATEHEFHCPEHGELLQQYDNEHDIEDIRGRIDAIRTEMERTNARSHEHEHPAQ